MVSNHVHSESYRTEIVDPTIRFKVSACFEQWPAPLVNALGFEAVAAQDELGRLRFDIKDTLLITAQSFFVGVDIALDIFVVVFRFFGKRNGDGAVSATTRRQFRGCDRHDFITANAERVEHVIEIVHIRLGQDALGGRRVLGIESCADQHWGGDENGLKIDLASFGVIAVLVRVAAITGDILVGADERVGRTLNGGGGLGIEDHGSNDRWL